MRKNYVSNFLGFALGCLWATWAFAMPAPTGNHLSMSADRLVPGARGEIQTKDSRNGTRVRLAVQNLARPDSISNNAAHYVVWAKADDAEPARNLGVIHLNSSLNGNFEAEVPAKKFTLFVTPEPEAQASYPDGDRVLWTSVVR